MEAIGAFVPQFVAAIQTGDANYLYDHLHPEVILRYGEEACRADMENRTDERFDLVIQRIDAPERWAWTSDEQTRTVADVYPIEVQLTTTESGTQTTIIHLAVEGLDVRWFTDCGTPLPTPQPT